MPNNHEPEFRDRLYDYESPVDPEAIWQAVNTELNPPRKRWKLLWWLPGLLLVLGAFGAYVLQEEDSQVVNSSNSQVVKQSGSQTAAGQPTTGNPQPATDNGQLDNKRALERPNRQSTTDNGQQPRPQDAVDEPAIAMDAITLNGATDPRAGVPRPTDNRQPTTDNVQPDNKQALERPNRQPITDNGQQPRSQDAVDEPAIAINETLLNEVEASRAGAPRPDEQPTTDNPTTQKPDNPTTRQLHNPTTPQPGNPTTPLLTTASPLPWPSITLSAAEASPAENLEVIESAFTPARQQVWTFGLSSTFSQVSQTFEEGDVQRGDDELLPFYQANVRPLEAISTDLLVGYQSRNNWTIRSGLGYTRINSVAEANSVTVNDSLRGEGIVRIDVRAPGDTNFVMGIVDITQTSTRSQRYYNNLTLLDIPLLFGRRFTFGKLDLNLEAGPVLNLYARASARLPISANTFSERSETESLFRTSLGISWRGQASVGYRLSEKLSLHAGIDYRRLPRQGVTTASAPVKTRYNLVGGQLGVRYRF